MDHYYNSIMSNNNHNHNHNHTSLWNKCKLKRHAEYIQEHHEETGGGEFQLRSASSLPLIPQQPQTPKEPMEFLSRSWSISAEEISKALASRHKHFLLDNTASGGDGDGDGGGGGSPLTRTVTSPAAHMVSDRGISINPYPIFHPDHHHHHRVSEKSSMGSSTNSRRIGSISRWFNAHHHHHSKDYFSSPNHHNHSSSVRKKDRARVENAHMHALLSIAGLSAALAAVANSENENSGGSKMGRAMASASELLASHCIEMAEQSGIENDRIAAVVKSAVDIKSAGDLMTLTAAAATALRGEAALRSRLPKEGRRTASISPCDKTVMAVADAQCGGATLVDPLLPAEVVGELTSPSCAGELMQHTRKGALRWKRVTVYINKKSQVMMKMKSKHVGGAFSKRDKCLVYGVCDQISAWPARKTERENTDSYFGLKTAQGFLEFKCKNKVHKNHWVDGIQSLLRQIGDVDAVLDKCMRHMTITHNPLHSIKSFEKEETISL